MPTPDDTRPLRPLPDAIRPLRPLPQPEPYRRLGWRLLKILAALIILALALFAASLAGARLGGEAVRLIYGNELAPGEQAVVDRLIDTYGPTLGTDRQAFEDALFQQLVEDAEAALGNRIPNEQPVVNSPDITELVLHAWSDGDYFRISARSTVNIDEFDLDVVVYHGSSSSTTYCNPSPIWAGDPPLRLGCGVAARFGPGQVTRISASIDSGLLSPDLQFACMKTSSDDESAVYACHRR